MYDYEMDPSGDAVITLWRSTTPFAAWKAQSPCPERPDSFGLQPFGLKGKKKGKAYLDTGTEPVQTPEQDKGPEVAFVQFLVSSRHLTLASPMMLAMLSGDWTEGSKDENGLFQIEARDWDEEAFAIVFNVVHGRNHRVPVAVSLELLTKIAVIVDYYNMHEAVRIAASVWVATARKCGLPNELNRDLALWLTIACVFKDAEIFKHTTSLSIIQSSHDLEFPDDLPIPSCVVDRIKEFRHDALSAIVEGLQKLREEYTTGQKGCSFECTAIHLGVLIRTIHEVKLDGWSTEDITVQDLAQGLEAMQPPRWRDYSPYGEHSCPQDGSQVWSSAFNLSANNTSEFKDARVVGTLNRYAAQLMQNVQAMGVLGGFGLSDFVELEMQDESRF
ncbi:hypothetical protein OQA88_4842 [Cercophora sp. LCS_1]